MTASLGAVLVLGATGNQGGAVARHLLDRGHRVGHPVRYVALPYESAARFDPGLAVLGAWLDREGYRADIPALRRLHPGLLTLNAWLRHTGWFDQPVPDPNDADSTVRELPGPKDQGEASCR
jgi:hypothetical protein